jgi:hypothetical protein
MKNKSVLILLVLLITNSLSAQILQNSDSTKLNTKLHDPSSAFNIISPNGYGLGRGEFYYRNSDILFNSFGYGITKNFNINAVIELYSTIEAFSGDKKTPTFVVMPQYNINVSGKIHAGVGFAYLVTESRLNEYNSVLPVLSFNYGNRDNYIGMNLAYGFFDVTNVKTQVYSVFIQLKTDEKWRFVTEYISFESVNMFNLGLKYIFKHGAVSFGLNNYFLNKGFLPLPFVILTFGNSKY